MFFVRVLSAGHFYVSVLLWTMNYGVLHKQSGQHFTHIFVSTRARRLCGQHMLQRSQARVCELRHRRCYSVYVFSRRKHSHGRHEDCLWRHLCWGQWSAFVLEQNGNWRSWSVDWSRYWLLFTGGSSIQWLPLLDVRSLCGNYILQVKSTRQENFFVEFHSSCLESKLLTTSIYAMFLYIIC